MKKIYIRKVVPILGQIRGFHEKELAF